MWQGLKDTDLRLAHSPLPVFHWRDGRGNYRQLQGEIKKLPGAFVLQSRKRGGQTNTGFPVGLGKFSVCYEWKESGHLSSRGPWSFSVVMTTNALFSTCAAFEDLPIPRSPHFKSLLKGYSCRRYHSPLSQQCSLPWTPRAICAAFMAFLTD